MMFDTFFMSLLALADECIVLNFEYIAMLLPIMRIGVKD